MKKIKNITIAALILLTLNLFGQEKSFESIYHLIDQKSFFRAREIYGTAKYSLSPVHQKVIEAFLYNAFGRMNESNEKIAKLIQDNQLAQFADSLQIALYTIKMDNFVKVFEYKEAKNTIEFILENFNDALSEDLIRGYQNALNIFTALENQPKQRVTINDGAKIKIVKDRFRMNNLPVSNGSDTLNFLFDTGANLSAVSRSVAEQFNMNILPVTIEATGVTGARVPVQVAICPVFYLGDIRIENAVFLVVDDRELEFRLLFIRYRVLGIIGYPVMAALGEVQFTNDEYFIVPQEESVFEYSNMAMSGLTPLISVEGNPFVFDTGARQSSFYRPYYLANREEIVSDNRLRRIGKMGAGGRHRGRGYLIDATLTVAGREVTLNRLRVWREYYVNQKGMWGFIGKDIIEQFDRTTINFKI